MTSTLIAGPGEEPVSLAEAKAWCRIDGDDEDGLVAALQLLSVVKQFGRPVSEVCQRFAKVPKLLQSVRYKQGKPLDNKAVVQVIAEGRARLGDSGRLVIRESGTEPMIRVMAESDDEGLVKAVVADIAEAIRQVA